MSVATAGVAPEDAGVASAAVNTMQQVGGSIGTALLNTLAATAAATYLTHHAAGKAATAQAQLHSYATAYWWSAGLFAAGTVLAALMFRSGASQPAATRATSRRPCTCEPYPRTPRRELRAESAAGVTGGRRPGHRGDGTPGRPRPP